MQKSTNKFTLTQADDFTKWILKKEGNVFGHYANTLT